MQRLFCPPDALGKIWRAKRSDDGRFRQVELKPIKKSFVIRDYNTILVDDRRSDLIERDYYGPIDDFLGAIIPEVVDILDQKAVPIPPKTTLTGLAKATLYLARRTPDFNKDHCDLALGRKFITSVIDELLGDHNNAEIKKLKAELDDEALLTARGRHIRVRGTIHISDELLKAMNEFDLKFVVCPANHSFVLSSKMALFLGNGGPNGLRNPMSEIWVPISPKYALVFLKDPNGKLQRINHIDRQMVRKINEYAVSQSFEVASHSEKLLRSLTKNSVARPI